jgi:N-acetylneuraminate synthase
MKKPLLIAEIGINHNGDINIAKKLIDNSKSAGFDAVKFQKRNIYKVYDKKILETPRESPWGNNTEKQKLGLELSQKDYEEIDKYCKQINIDWFASAWEEDSLNFLKKFDLKYNKIASAMIVDRDFLKAVAQEKKHTFISTGMSTTKNIEDAVEIFSTNKCSFELMHCVSTYPMKTKDANLKTIDQLKREFKCDVGYSGHENGVVVSLAALSFGISSLERHITLDRTMYGSDQSASLEYNGMKFLTESIKKFCEAIGQEKMGNILEDEIPIAKKLRAHIKS